MAVQWIDRHGQTWDVLFTHGLCDRIKAEASVDLYRAMEMGNTIGELLFNDFGRRLVMVMYVVCEPEVTARGLEPEQWNDLFDGPTVERASEAFMSGLADFFPRSRIGKAVRENMAKAMAELDADVLKKLKLGSRAGFAAPSSTSPDVAG